MNVLYGTFFLILYGTFHEFISWCVPYNCVVTKHRLDRLRLEFAYGVNASMSQVHKGQIECMMRLYVDHYQVQEEAALDLKKKRTNFTKSNGDSVSKGVNKMNQQYNTDSDEYGNCRINV
jgi:hypothetical protein